MKTVPGALFRSVLAAIGMAGLVQGAVAAGSVDAELAVPAGYTKTADEAKVRIDALRDLAKEHPERELEINAYLIPLERLVEAGRAEKPPEANEAKEAVPPPEPKILALVRIGPGETKAVPAKSVEENGPMVIITGEDGTRSVVQPRNVVGRLPRYTDEELRSGAVDLEGLAKQYEALSRSQSSIRNFLAGEAARMRTIHQAITAKQIETKPADSGVVDRIISQTYDPETDYSTKELAGLLLEAEKARKEFPDSAEKLDEWAAPFRTHFEQRLAGRQRFDGKWLSPAEIIVRKREIAEDAFQRTFSAPLDAVALTNGEMKTLVVLSGGGAALLILVGIALLFVRSRPGLRLLGVGLSLGTIILAGALFLLASSDPKDVPPITADTTTAPLMSALFAASKQPIDIMAHPQSVSDASINTLLAQRAAPIRPSERDPWIARREALAVQLAGNRAVFFELIRAFDRDWVVRYQVVLGAEPKLNGAWIGRVKCPPPLNGWLWDSLRRQLERTLANTAILATYDARIDEDGMVYLQPKAAANR